MKLYRVEWRYRERGKRKTWLYVAIVMAESESAAIEIMKAARNWGTLDAGDRDFGFEVTEETEGYATLPLRYDWRMSPG